MQFLYCDVNELVHKIDNAADFIRQKTDNRPPVIGLILGSGLGEIAEQIENATCISYHQIPDFPISTVEGHKGEMIIGDLAGKIVVALAGRFHYYEGYKISEVTIPVRVMQKLGMHTLLITNASGGINTGFIPGDLMLIKDHINFGFVNPLIGPNLDKFGPRFPDVSNAYDKDLQTLAKQSAAELGIALREGTYVFSSGPSYETPAEVKMLRWLGADAVGMSTVPEVLAAVHGGVKVLGISCITNMAAGILDQPLTHEEVIETTQKVKSRFIKLVRQIISRI